MVGSSDMSAEQRRLLEQLLKAEGVELQQLETTHGESAGGNFDPRGGVWGEVQAEFFGNPQSQLYGVHHKPRGGRRRESGLVLCNALGQEYMRSHRAFVQLAGLLAREGFPVFRFDYFGTGDSSGELPDATLARWRQDVAEAIREMGRVSGAGRVSLIGLRAGAAIAAAVSPRSPLPVDALILWDPVVSGTQLLERQARTHRQVLVDPWRFAIPRKEHLADDADELLGFAFPAALREEIGRIKLPTAVAPDARRVLIACSEERPEYRELHERLAAMGVRAELQISDGLSDWNDPARIEEAYLPSELIQALIRFMGEAA